jgi:hypothetical protein
LRQVAYTLLARLVGSNCVSVSEYRRVQRQQQQGKVLEIMSPQALQEAITYLENASTWPSPQIKNFSKPAQYLSLLTMDPYDPNDTRVPYANRALEQVVCEGLPQEGQEQWIVVHLTAQAQAYAYSLKILKDVLSLFDAACLDAVRTDPVLASYRAVAEAVDSMAISTSLDELPDVRAVKQYIDDLKQSDKKAEVQAMLGLTAEQCLPWQSLGTKRGKQAERLKEANGRRW